MPLLSHAGPTERVFTGFAADHVFQAASKAARENFMLTYVDKKNMTFVFHTDVAFTYGFDWNASVVKTRDGVKLAITVPGQPRVLSSSACQRIAEQLFEATVQNLLTEQIIECRAPQPPRGDFAFWSAEDEAYN